MTKVEAGGNRKLFSGGSVLNQFVDEENERGLALIRKYQVRCFVAIGEEGKDIFIHLDAQARNTGKEQEAGDEVGAILARLKALKSEKRKLNSVLLEAYNLIDKALGFGTLEKKGIFRSSEGYVSVVNHPAFRWIREYIKIKPGERVWLAKDGQEISKEVAYQILEAIADFLNKVRVRHDEIKSEMEKVMGENQIFFEV